MTNKLLRKATAVTESDAQARFESFNLRENPFPSDPFVNKESTDIRINGHIYEMAIRELEYAKIKLNFLTKPLSSPNHLRLGYIIEDSYVGRGNGKSAFLVNLQQQINDEYCLDISGGINKCFAVYVEPEAGGRTKMFASFVDQMFHAIKRLNIIEDAITTLVLDSIATLYPEFNLEVALSDNPKIYEKFTDNSWFKENGFNLDDIIIEILKNEALQVLPKDFPLISQSFLLLKSLPTVEDFDSYYFGHLKKGKERYDFVFSNMVSFFIAAGFNGAFILVDDFEKILDFQSSRQKKDFALELRSHFYDGYYLNARLGFYNIFLVIQGGVQNLISEAWSASGLDNRAAISPKIDSEHVIAFQKLNNEHVSLLIQTYLDEYRIKPMPDSVAPFTPEAVKLIGEMSELNASKILKTCYYLLENAADESTAQIDVDFVHKHEEDQNRGSDKKSLGIEDVDSEDLLRKALSD